ncbi:MAG: ACT domain-containing protein [Eubacteriaceae bacterium]|nr:ACT domain-containing protein [Eubacteriaceae bacterium]
MINNESIIKAITIDDEIVKITVMEVPDRPGIAFQLFSAISKENVRVESIVQNVHRNNLCDITFTVSIEDEEKALKITQDFAGEIGASEVYSDNNVARLSVIGAAIVANSQVASKFFKALYEKSVNIQMISTSEDKISCVIDKSMSKEALKQIYLEFEMR